MGLGTYLLMIAGFGVRWQLMHCFWPRYVAFGGAMACAALTSPATAATVHTYALPRLMAFSGRPARVYGPARAGVNSRLEHNRAISKSVHGGIQAKVGSALPAHRRARTPVA